MKRCFGAILCAVISLAVFSTHAAAQVSGVVRVDFVMPQGLDPSDRLTITMDGHAYMFADGGGGPGSEAGSRITGGLFATGGMDIHGLVPGPGAGIVPVVQLEVFTSYEGPIDFESSSAISPFTPWTVGSGIILGGGQTFILTKSMNGAPLIETGLGGGFFGMFTASNSTREFDGASFRIRGFIAPHASVPEPGILSLFGGMAALGITVVRKRRHAGAR